MSDVHSAMTQIEDVSKMSADDLACLLDSVTDAALKASAELLVETMSEVL